MRDDLRTIAAHIAELLVARGETVSVAESSAGGLIASVLLAAPGASRFFVGGGVIYTATARAAFLGITPEQMAGLKPATQTYAALLAAEVRSRLATTWGLGETGAAGPTANGYGDPPGHCCFAVSGPVELAETLETAEVDRWANMHAFSHATLALFATALCTKQ